MQIQLASDLHIETKGGLNAPTSAYPVAKSPILALAGDVYPAMAPEFGEIIRRVAEPFRLVLYVPGNHEYYGGIGSISEMDRIMQQKCDAIPNVLYFNKTSITVHGTLIAGCTMWTNVPKSLWATAANEINDYRFIRTAVNHTFTPKDSVTIHLDHKKWLKDTLSQARRGGVAKRAIIITHHAPTDALSERTQSRSRETFPYYFASDMGDLTTEPFVKVWCYGHTHESQCIRLTGHSPLFCCNGAGYPFENTGYTDDAVITVSP